MNKYTEADYRNVHKGVVEDMIDHLLGKWHDQECDPLKARVCRNLASEMEALRETKVESVNVWVSAANEEHTNTRSKS